MDYFSTILMIALPQTPLFLVDIIGFIIAIVRKDRHPRISLLAGIYFVGSFFLSVVGLGVSIMPLFISQTHALGVSDIGMIVTVMGLVNITLSTILAIILLFAVFGWREMKQPSTVAT
jgi:hypothetical protein